MMLASQQQGLLQLTKYLKQGGAIPGKDGVFPGFCVFGCCFIVDGASISAAGTTTINKILKTGRCYTWQG
jgi:hypothetical protein